MASSGDAGAVVEMDQLASKQEATGKELQKIIANYKKDPADRKTLQYYQERLQRLEASWSRFETTDNTIRALKNIPLSHSYFVSDYYNSTMKIYSQYQEHFLEVISALQKKSQDKGDNAGELDQIYALPHDPMLTLEKVNSIEEDEEPAIGFKPQAARISPSRLTSLDAEPSEITRLMRRQRGVIESLRRILIKISNDTEDHPKQYFELKLKAIEQYWSQIEEHNHSIWELCEDPAAAGYNISEYIELEEKVQECLVQLSTKFDEFATATPTPSMPSNSISVLQLPKITLPKFDADYLKWRQFYDLYTQMVHKQPMADCQKMWYLKTNLTGEAEKLIRHFTLSDDNYAAAWKILQDRYENTRLLVSALLNKLLTQPNHASDSGTAATIKALHDTTQECLLGLENLGVQTTSWDPLLLHILIKKLDRTTHTLYEQSLPNPRSLQTMTSFLTFLETRFQSLEALGNKGKGVDENSRSRSFAKSLTSVITQGTNCICCKGSHRLFLCKKFLQLTPLNRLNLLRKHNYCINCLRGGHIADKCTMRGCTKCNKKHNTLIHMDNATSPEKPVLETAANRPQPISDRQSNQPSALTTVSNQNQRSYVLLSTARVKLANSNGSSIECRAILDSGSQVNLITERIAKKLGLSAVAQPMFIQGIGQVKQRAQHRVNLLLQSRLNGFSTRLEAFVLPKIISEQPSQPLNILTWNIPQNIKLADPDFNQPDRIDVLLGAEFHHQLLSIGQIKLADELPTLQNTVFGWILSGRINNLPQPTVTCGVCSEDEGLDQRIEKFWVLEEAEGITTAGHEPTGTYGEGQFGNSPRAPGSSRL